MKKIVCGNFGTIYYAQILKNGLMSSDNRVDVTDDALRAVADHIMFMNEYKENDGFSGYQYGKVGGGSVQLVVYDTDKYALVSREKLEKLPSADLMEVKRGEWIIEYHGNGWNDYWDYTCSVCGKKFEKADNVLYRAKFCPNCGCRMKGVDNESNADSNTINTLDALDSSEKPNNSDASKVKQVEKYPYNCNWDE